MQIHWFSISIGIVILSLACANSHTAESQDKIVQATQETNSVAKSEVQTLKEKIAVDEVSSVSDEKLVITFDELKEAEIIANNNSNDGHNKKLPFVFMENGMSVELSNIFYIASPYGHKNPISSPPYSMSGSNSFLTINGGSTFTVEQAMIGSLSSPAKIKLIGYKDGEIKYTKELDIDYAHLKGVEIDFVEIDNFSMQARPDRAAVADDIVIRL